MNISANDYFLNKKVKLIHLICYSHDGVSEDKLLTAKGFNLDKISQQYAGYLITVEFEDGQFKTLDFMSKEKLTLDPATNKST